MAREPRADVRINRVQLITQPKPEAISKTSLGKKSSIYITSCKGENSENGVGRTVCLIPKLESSWDKAKKTSWALAARIYLLSNCVLQPHPQGWCKLQVQNVKAAASMFTCFLLYSIGEAEAANIWKHLQPIF